jgi:hypothetical protein
MACTTTVSGNEEHYIDWKALRLTSFCWTTWQCFNDLLDLIGCVDGHHSRGEAVDGVLLLCFDASHGGCWWLSMVVVGGCCVLTCPKTLAISLQLF